MIGLGQFEEDFMPRQDDWWQRYVYDSTQRGLDILGSRYGQGQYLSPDDPRYRRSGSGGGYYPIGAGQPQYGMSPGGVSSQGFQINWWTAALIGVVVGSFLLGRRR